MIYISKINIPCSPKLNKFLLVSICIRTSGPHRMELQLWSKKLSGKPNKNGSVGFMLKVGLPKLYCLQIDCVCSWGVVISRNVIWAWGAEVSLICSVCLAKGVNMCLVKPLLITFLFLQTKVVVSLDNSGVIWLLEFMSSLHNTNLSVFTFKHMHASQPLGLTQENPLVTQKIQLSKKDHLRLWGQ